MIKKKGISFFLVFTLIFAFFVTNNVEAKEKFIETAFVTTVDGKAPTEELELEVNSLELKDEKGINILYLENGKDYEIKYNEDNYTLKSITIDDKVVSTNNILKLNTDKETEFVYLDFIENIKYSKFKATLEDNNSNIKVKLDEEDYKLGKEIDLKKGEHVLEFINVPEGFYIYKVEDGLNSIVKNGKYKFTLDSDLNLEFKVIREKEVGLKRFAGKDRYETSAKIAENIFKNPKNIVLVNGVKEADALSAGPLANELEGPILLTNGKTISKPVADYIESTKASKVYIVGGKESVANSLKEELSDDYKLEVERIAGENRYETSAKVAEVLIEDHKYKNEIILANGVNAADAISASPLAIQEKYPIILTNGSIIEVNVLNKLNDFNIKDAIIVGGKNSVSNNILNNTNILLEERIAGENRYETSIEVARELNNINNLVLASGVNYIDALTASSVAGIKNAPIILVDGKEINKETEKYIKNIKNNIFEVYVVGGTDSINSDLAKEILNLTK
ncbi:MAG: cell wall-binding repeat-containing protein [Miniphocaeibacter sp.]|uniref:cell wall-binding repeat-containing protein n=1 Tax=Miniphocaeibacter sp. TaxID=3100973 RepID=UPI003BB08090